jgi:WD40 repeat protein
LLLLALSALAADTPAVDRHGDPLPPGARVRLGSVRFRHPGQGLAGLVVVSDRALVSVGEDGCVCWWDLASGKLTRISPGASYTRAFALSRDGKLLTVAGFRPKKQETDPNETIVRVLDAATGKEVREFSRGREGHERGNSLAFSPDGKLLFSATREGNLRVEEVATGAELLRENVSAGSYAALALSPDGKVPASARDDGTVRLWDVATGKETATLVAGDAAPSR